MLKLLFISTPVGALGTGQGGGVELTIQNLAQELQKRGYVIEVVAPAGSVLQDIPVTGIPGNLQIAVQTQGRDIPTCLPSDSVLANMLDYCRQVQHKYDLIVNFAFDWLPFYLTPFFHCPIAHFISMGSMSVALDEIMSQIATNYPQNIGVYTKSQADTFPFADKCKILSSAIDLSLYKFSPHPEKSLAWLGRIAPEKALEDAVAAVNVTGTPLKIYGKIQDPDYWQQIQQDFPNAPIEYKGFLGTNELQQELGKCRALLMTPRWIEAFGNVAIEALACGVPVIAYARGGPKEIVKDGVTGFLVEPDSIEGLVTAINQIDLINRYNCRQQAEVEYSLTSLGDRFCAWFNQILETQNR
ncbi:MAG: glycosyltransferase family 4 protein [Xenococcaceae cyanobacterium MO_188.B19]|nr:glycosyltransferase family 4 protein [Xenococcaceae cyanobacterium MO_188.B19]